MTFVGEAREMLVQSVGLGYFWLIVYSGDANEQSVGELLLKQRQGYKVYKKYRYLNDDENSYSTFVLLLN